MKKYVCLSQQEISRDDYMIRPVQPEYIEKIRVWRNAQIDVLRQNSEISATEQTSYYSKHVWPDMKLNHPNNIIVGYLKNNELIGYGGLVHIKWEHCCAEVSFLVNPELAFNKNEYQNNFFQFLTLIKNMAFKHVGLNRVYTETYHTRKHHIGILESAGFLLEGRLREHVFISGAFVDSLIHGILKKDEG